MFWATFDLILGLLLVALGVSVGTQPDVKKAEERFSFFLALAGVALIAQGAQVVTALP